MNLGSDTTDGIESTRGTTSARHTLFLAPTPKQDRQVRNRAYTPQVSLGLIQQSKQKQYNNPGAVPGALAGAVLLLLSENRQRLALGLSLQPACLTFLQMS